MPQPLVLRVNIFLELRGRYLYFKKKETYATLRYMGNSIKFILLVLGFGYLMIKVIERFSFLGY